ncbi:DDRGK domain-containing protein 1-like, partial [Pundamilia nyererei]|uniref:DDRGK domain-containing protein 1-like n=1 Tax=Pundamilia nyererei TaxID=303518 RepID=A0A9Y3VWA3_9CICH
MAPGVREESPGCELETSQTEGQTESQTEGQTESQTSDVMVYEIFGFEDVTLPYSLTIIDTPGYGDTRGIEHEDIISHRLLNLFQSEDGVHEVHAVGLVMKASVNRLSERLLYVFDSVMSLFGKNMEKNIVALITHSDGSRPENAFKALEVAEIKCAKNEKNRPVHFLFNNSQYENRTEENKFSKLSWELTQENMNQLTDFMGNSNPQTLMKAVEVLNERIRLKACIQNLKERIELGELKQTEIGQKREALKKHEEKQREEKKKLEEAKKIYETLKNQGEQKREEALKIQQTIKELEAEMKRNENFTVEVDELEQIALKADSASTIVHLDFLIEKMKEKGNTEKVQKLEEMRSR